MKLTALNYQPWSVTGNSDHFPDPTPSLVISWFNGVVKTPTIV